MSIAMDQDKLKMLAAELARDIKSEIVPLTISLLPGKIWRLYTESLNLTALALAFDQWWYIRYHSNPSTKSLPG